MNLGDWPLNKKGKNDPSVPVFSWCGSSDSRDIVWPTWDLMKSIIMGMDRCGGEEGKEERRKGDKGEREGGRERGMEGGKERGRGREGEGGGGLEERGRDGGRERGRDSFVVATWYGLHGNSLFTSLATARVASVKNNWKGL